MRQKGRRGKFLLSTAWQENEIPPLTQSIEVFVQVQNLLDRRFIAASYTAPSAQAFGPPLTVFAGLRVSLAGFATPK